ncbi:MAG: aminotransferase class I/II-fold pyridoxal phosphate-dependent enzyme [marine benthic group bacterium]|jgi:methionine-gamma-lyase|nr:aminotransferase class I/II-fold pyridoxal phosphate-dependent enzyme [Gemmatimonadota bacterium]MCL7966704.1 aminotransferase class I/II-fold pyridoxal phosphate-dependent enzyme [Gemmatimonadota bacterium]MCL7974657.1 aminotransferase class I/II-fold pyridoxal phosphate-dependent enzyme [Gemmatimonadota bacterium]MCL7976796.1 aminotransferase class I/II-fold pyridoxal phosphate-dependent enzyme [Gemmatimonadota bacterium]MCL7982003.1 aminotransferase class I/II-fold pyridoxal phosphate-dep
MNDERLQGPNTKIIHGGQHPDRETGAVSVPIYQSSTFAFESAEHGAACFRGGPGYKYTRLGNPTTEALERSVAFLEGGAGALGAASGMAAINSLYMTLLGAGAHMVAGDALYGPSRTIVETEFSRFGVEADFVDSSDPANVERAIRPETVLVYIETPANPTLKLTDIEACAEIAHAHGSVLAVDNTFASPHLQNPIELGADIVVHSMTKFINGHSDVVAGMIVAADEEMLERLRRVHVNLGGTMDPHQAWLVLRGIKTLGLRVEKAQANAMAVARHLEAHPAVEWVRYPGLESHPQHELASRQMRGPGGIISFGVVGGVEGGQRFIDAAELMVRAVSLGGIETLVEHPASMTHKGVPVDERLEAGITDDLVRVAVGCEDSEDLIADLDRALEQAMSGVAVGV